MDKFLETHNLPRPKHEKTETWIDWISSQKLSNKENPKSGDLTSEFHQILKEEF